MSEKVEDWLEGKKQMEIQPAESPQKTDAFVELFVQRICHRSEV